MNNNRIKIKKKIILYYISFLVGSVVRVWKTVVLKNDFGLFSLLTKEIQINEGW